MNMEAELPLFKNIDEGSTPHQELDSGRYSKHIVNTPTKVESMLEDYAATNISIHSHPIQLLRENGLLGKYTAAEDLISCRHKSVVTVVGLVTGRQSPGTAGGVTFVTLEDDTGSSNVVIWVATARAQKKSFLTSTLLKVKGVVEREGRVIHVIAGKLIDLSDELQELEIKSRDFH